MTNLVERAAECARCIQEMGLQNIELFCDRQALSIWFEAILKHERSEAATALEAKDKELAALRDELESYNAAYNGLMKAKEKFRAEAHRNAARAETAERERDEAREALKPLSRLAIPMYPTSNYDNYQIYHGDIRAARAITGGEAVTKDKELAALREALKPFAALARWLPTKTPDDEVVYRASTIVITAGDLRRAALAITGGKP